MGDGGVVIGWNREQLVDFEGRWITVFQLRGEIGWHVVEELGIRMGVLILSD